MDEDKEIDACDEIVARWGDDPAKHIEVAVALVRKGDRLCSLGRDEEAVAAYDEVVARFANEANPAMHWKVVAALSNKLAALRRLRRDEDLGIAESELASFQEWTPAIGIYGGKKGTPEVAAIKLAALRRLGWSTRVAEAELVVASAGDSTDLVPPQQVADALMDKALHCAYMGDRDYEAVEALDEIVARYGNSSDPAVLEQVAKALYVKVAEYGASAHQLVARFGHAPERVLRRYVAQGLLKEIAEPEAAIALGDELLALFGDDPAFGVYVAQGLRRKGEALAELGRLEELITLCDEIVARAGAVPGLDYQAAWARVAKANALKQRDRSEEAIDLCDQVISLHTPDVLASDQSHWSEEIVWSDRTLWNRPEEEYLAARDRRKALILESVAWASVNKIEALIQLRRLEEAIVLCDEVTARFEREADEQVAWALINKGDALSQLGRLMDARRAYDEIVTRFNKRDYRPFPELVAKARAKKRLVKRGRLSNILASLTTGRRRRDGVAHPRGG